MFRMLIVDDVHIIVDSLFDLFEELPHLELELYKAYSAVEALKILKSTKIDLVLTDIKMPEMTGLEMLGQIRKQWPRCKVIFLTSYNDFDYVQEAIASGGFDYLLKTEGDPAIVHSIEKAIAAMKEETAIDHLIDRTQQQLRASLPALQKEYLWDLAQGKAMSAGSLKSAFEDMGISLSVTSPVFLLIGRIDSWKQATTPSDKALLLYAIHNIVHEYLSPMVRLIHIPFEQSKIIWFIQPLDDHQADHPEFTEATQRTFQFLHGTLESIQASFKDKLQLTVSFMLSKTPAPWLNAADRFQQMKTTMSWGLGLRSGMLLTDPGSEFELGRHQNHPGIVSGRGIPFSHIGAMSHFLDNNQKNEYFELFDATMRALAEEASTIQERLAVYYGLSSIFLMYINQRGVPINPDERTELRLDRLSGKPEQEDWPETANYLRKLAEWIFEHKKEEQSDQAQAIVFKIHSYIEANLDGDTSLTRLADLVNLNPSYLSRLYKEITGRVLSDHISEVRIQTAVRLLRENVLKVHEIATVLGYNSTFAFTRFFKSHMHMVPQEYRQSLDFRPK
jgi:two-component system response regulator YesN